MKQYEYKCEAVNEGIPDLMEQLNTPGRDGWHCFEVTEGGGRSFVILWLSRVVEPTP